MGTRKGTSHLFYASIYAIVVIYNQSKQDVGYNEHDIQCKRLPSSIEATSGDEESKESRLKNDDASGDAQFFEDPAGDRVSFPFKIMRPHHQPSGMCIKDV